MLHTGTPTVCCTSLHVCHLRIQPPCSSLVYRCTGAYHSRTPLQQATLFRGCSGPCTRLRSPRTFAVEPLAICLGSGTGLPGYPVNITGGHVRMTRVPFGSLPSRIALIDDVRLLNLQEVLKHSLYPSSVSRYFAKYLARSIRHFTRCLIAVSYTHLTLPTKRIV